MEPPLPVRGKHDWWADGPPLSRAKPWAIIGIVLVALIAIIALFTIPLPHGFAGSVSTAYCSGCTPTTYFGYVIQAFPSWSTVRMTWQSTSGLAVNFSVSQGVLYVSIGDQPVPSPLVCYASGASGSCSFTASSGTYTIYVEDHASSEGAVSVAYYGTYAMPYA